MGVDLDDREGDTESSSTQSSPPSVQTSSSASSPSDPATSTADDAPQVSGPEWYCGTCCRRRHAALARAERVDGQAERIIEELRGGAVKRFRSDKIEELRAYFQEEGYLSEREPLDSTACWRRAIAEASDAITEDLISEDDVESVLDRVLDRARI